MNDEKRFSLYDWVDVPIARSRNDTRSESFKVKYHDLTKVGHIPPDGANWAERARWIFADPTWQYDAVSTLIEASKLQRKSLGIITPAEVLGVELERKQPAEEADFKRKLGELADKAKQADLFAEPRDVKDLRYRPFKIFLKWRCPGACEICARSSHRMQVLDWGLFQLAQKTSWEKAADHLATLADDKTHQFRLFLGNTKAHQHNFLIVGLWYPKLQAQLALF